MTRSDASAVGEPVAPVIVEIGGTLLRRFLALLCIALALNTAYLYHSGARHLADYTFIILSLPIMLCYRQLLTGRVDEGLNLFSWGMWLAIGIIAVFVAGINSSAIFLYPVLIMLTGWLRGRRQAFGMCLGTALVLLMLVVGVDLGWLTPTVRRTPITMLMTFVPISLLAAMLSSALYTRDQHQLVTERALRASLQERLAELQRSDEEVRALNEELEQRVVARTAELSATVEQLTRTQRELVEAEKLASLGALVAGVAHELNTPIGNALTTATGLSTYMAETQQGLAEGRLSRSGLERFFSQGSGMVDLIARSCARIGALVVSFKQVAVDRSSELRQSFSLRDAIDGTISTMRPNCNLGQ